LQAVRQLLGVYLSRAQSLAPSCWAVILRLIDIHSH